jgi:hypothetical protein
MVQRIKKSEGTTVLIKDLRGMIEQAHGHVAHAIYSTLVMPYWRIGQRINLNILKHKRAGYREEIVSTVSRQLGWSHCARSKKSAPKFLPSSRMPRDCWMDS